MTSMGRSGEARSGWLDAGTRLVAHPRTRTAAALLLGVVAVSTATERAVATNASVPYGLVLCLLALASTLPLALPDRADAALAVTAAAALSVNPFHSLTLAGATAELVVLYRLARGGSRVLVAFLATPFLVFGLSGTGAGALRVLVVLLAVLAPAAAWTGAAQRSRTETSARDAAREVVIGTLLEHTARGERARIAHELHDVVAHHISMIAVQAETARLATPGMPAAGAQRLSAIGDTARAALTEMRRLLGVLREDSDAGAPELEPQPGLRQLNDLLDEARDISGVGTRLILHGTPVTLDPGVELAAYRIIQEALTNTRRHAPGAAVDVELHYVDDGLQVRIRDNGPGPPESSSEGGHGLLGMRERALAVGGELRTSAAVGGGFMVSATLPGKDGAA
jgi:signal transduction histidine kinase